MFTLFALLAALLGPGLVLADNSGGGPVGAATAVVGAAVPTANTAVVTGDVSTDPIPVDDNSGGGPVGRK
jgi:hypothetical protein